MAPKEAKAQSLENTTGTQAALTGAEVVASVTAAAASGHPTLNTKPLFKLMVEKKASDLFFTSRLLSSLMRSRSSFLESALRRASS